MAHRTATSHPIRFEVQLGDRGRLVLPAGARRRLRLSAGDRLMLTLDSSDEMRLVSLRRVVQGGKGLFRDVAPKGRLASDELIAERRREAKRENRA